MREITKKKYMPSAKDVISIIHSFIAETLLESEDVLAEFNNIRNQPWTLIVDDNTGDVDIYPVDPKDKLYPDYLLIACKHWEDLIGIPMDEYKEICDDMLELYEDEYGEVS